MVDRYISIMIKKEYIAYSGKAFSIEWYYNSKDKSQALTYFLSLGRKEKKKFLSLIKLIGDIGTIINKQKFRYEGDKIFAVKVNADRFLCFFFMDQKIIITNGFGKKQAKLPLKEKEKAIRYMKDYITREKDGIYYD